MAYAVSLLRKVVRTNPVNLRQTRHHDRLRSPVWPCPRLVDTGARPNLGIVLTEAAKQLDVPYQR